MASARVAAVLLLAAALSLHACGNSSDPDKIASRFIAEYYVKVDLSQAKTLTDGLATRKIEQEQALAEGRKAGEGTRRRDVRYRMLEKRSEDDRLFLVYELHIKGRGVPSLRKRAIVSLGRVGQGWRVTNFHDFDS